MSTDHLIRELAAQGARKPLPHIMTQALWWLAGTIVYLTATAEYNGLRADIMAKLASPAFAAELALLFALAFSAALAALCLSRPDGHQMPWVKYLPFGFTAALAIVAFSGGTNLSWDTLSHSAALGQFYCLWHIALFSIPLGVAIFLIVRRGAPIQCCWAGGMASLSATAFGYLFMRLVEQNDNPVHLIVWHALPILVMCGLGMMAGRLALHWR